MSLDEDISLAETAHRLASRQSDAADEAWFEQFGQLFFDEGVLERQMQADNERLRTFDALQRLRYLKAWGLAA